LGVDAVGHLFDVCSETGVVYYLLKEGLLFLKGKSYIGEESARKYPRFLGYKC
jgi:hypothetical protein